MTEPRIKPTHIGGQALLEGVMMRGRYNWAVAVRTPSGAIHVEEHDLPHPSTSGWRALPVARGMWAMVETLSLAMRAFSIAAQYAAPASLGDEPEDAPLEDPEPGEVSPDDSEPGRPASLEAAPEEPAGLSAGETVVALGFGVALAVVMFIVLPALATNWMVGDSLRHPFIWNIVDGLLRLVVFFGYIAAVGLVPDIRRVFAYHGAEHKTIHAFERGVPLDAHAIQRYETLHVRCGTSFLLMVMMVAIVVFSLVPGRAILGLWGISAGWAVVVFNIGIRIALLPLVAGLAYELTVKWAGTRPDDPLVKVLLWPGMQLQRLTTREPDDGMVEVAIAAVRPVIEREQREAAGAEEPDGAAAFDEEAADAPR